MTAPRMQPEFERPEDPELVARLQILRAIRTSPESQRRTLAMLRQRRISRRPLWPFLILAGSAACLAFLISAGLRQLDVKLPIVMPQPSMTASVPPSARPTSPESLSMHADRDSAVRPRVVPQAHAQAIQPIVRLSRRHGINHRRRALPPVHTGDQPASDAEPSPVRDQQTELLVESPVEIRSAATLAAALDRSGDDPSDSAPVAPQPSKALTLIPQLPGQAGAGRPNSQPTPVLAAQSGRGSSSGETWRMRNRGLFIGLFATGASIAFVGTVLGIGYASASHAKAGALAINN